MRIFSDLHLEFDNWRPAPPRSSNDILILAGDIAELGSCELAPFLTDMTNQHEYVLYVAGNHEFYDQTYPTSWEGFAHLGVTTLHNQRVEINGQGFLGSTLWSKPTSPLDVMTVELGMNDFRYIRTPSGRFSVHRMIEEHNAAVDFLRTNIRPGDIVITHHAPTFASISSEFHGSSINSGFATDLSDLIFDTQPALWIHGHTHSPSDYYVGNTRVIANPKGYGHENKNFNSGGYYDVSL